MVLNEDTTEGVQMVRKLQELDKGINERLEEQDEPELLEGIKLDVEDEQEAAAQSVWCKKYLLLS